MLNSILSKNIFQKVYKNLPEKIFKDSAHDIAHSLRVAQNSIDISREEGGDVEILVMAALLHDICNLNKNNPQAHKSSEFSCKKSEEILKSVNFSKTKLPIVLDAILCHSFSAGFIPQTLEGKIFQDADRLDSLGAIGVARAFVTSATFKSKLYSVKDPFLKKGRTADDKSFAIDHFFVKLFKLPELMQTNTGKEFAKKRILFMKNFLDTLKSEIGEKS